MRRQVVASAHIHQIIETLSRLALTSKEAENYGRRYAAGSSWRDLTLARDSIDSTAAAERELDQLMAGDPVDRQLLRRLLYREAIALFPAANAPVAADVFREAMASLDREDVGSQITGEIARLQAHEHELLGRLTEQAESSANFSRYLIGLGLLTSVGLLGFAGWRMTRDSAIRGASERALAAREEQYRQVVELAGDIIYRTDEEGRFTFCNEAALALLHFTLGEVAGRSYLKVIRQDKRREAERFYWRQLLRKQKNTYFEFPVIDGHGRERWLGQNVQLVVENGKPAGFQAIAREITERKRAEFELQKSRNFVAKIATTTPGVLYVYDLDLQRTVFSNREIITVLGYKPEEIITFERFTNQMVHPDDLPMINAHYESMRRIADGEVRRLEYRARHLDGHWVWLSGRETAFERAPNGEVSQIVGISQDTTARKAEQERLAYQANYDSLTGLPNRHNFWARLQTTLRRCNIEHSKVSLCLFDVDNFKVINDRFGHAAGDEVLEEVGNIVRTELRAVDVGGRLGGDEFCFLLPTADQDEAARVAERIRDRLSTLAFGIESGAPFTVTATFGVAESRPNIEVKALMEAADRALYRAKSAGRNRVSVDV